MLVVIIILAVLFLIFLTAFVLQTADTKHIARQLRQQKDDKQTRVVTTKFPLADNERLVAEINGFLREKLDTEQQKRINEIRMMEMVSNVSHDMRTPLTTILGYLRLIKDNRLSDAEKEKYLSIIEKRANALNKIINDFYDLSRLDEDNYSIELSELDVNSICREYIAENYDAITCSGRELDVDLQPEPAIFPADRSAIIRIYENIIGNAVKHGNGRIIVKSLASQEYYAICFSNESELLTDEQLARLFERSYTGSASRSNLNTGLGLSICKALAEKMGYSLSAVYENGYFTVTIKFTN